MSDELRRAFLERPTERMPDALQENAAPVDDELGETLWRIAIGELSGPEAERTIDVVLADPDTAELWRVTFAMAEAAGLRPSAEQAAPEPDAPTVEPAANDEPGRGGQWWSFVAVAAAAAAALVLFWPGTATPPPPDPEIDPVLRATDHAALASDLGDEALPRDGFVLRWTGGPADASYDVRVELGQRVIASGLDLREPEFTVPAAALAELVDGTTLSWRVTAIAPDGRRVDSPTFEARLQ